MSLPLVHHNTFNNNKTTLMNNLSHNLQPPARASYSRIGGSIYTPLIQAQLSRFKPRSRSTIPQRSMKLNRNNNFIHHQTPKKKLKKSKNYRIGNKSASLSRKNDPLNYEKKMLVNIKNFKRRNKKPVKEHLREIKNSHHSILKYTYTSIMTLEERDSLADSALKQDSPFKIPFQVKSRTQFKKHKGFSSGINYNINNDGTSVRAISKASSKWNRSVKPIFSSPTLVKSKRRIRRNRAHTNIKSSIPSIGDINDTTKRSGSVVPISLGKKINQYLRKSKGLNTLVHADQFPLLKIDKEKDLQAPKIEYSLNLEIENFNPSRQSLPESVSDSPPEFFFTKSKKKRRNKKKNKTISEE